MGWDLSVVTRVNRPQTEPGTETVNIRLSAKGTAGLRICGLSWVWGWARFTSGIYRYNKSARRWGWKGNIHKPWWNHHYRVDIGIPIPSLHDTLIPSGDKRSRQAHWWNHFATGSPRYMSIGHDRAATSSSTVIIVPVFFLVRADAQGLVVLEAVRSLVFVVSADQGPEVITRVGKVLPPRWRHNHMDGALTRYQSAYGFLPEASTGAVGSHSNAPKRRGQILQLDEV
ncbi:hypothetical protein C8R43DRAFT_955140 [Mycena crocata]|nr:hypothetical protein C8R43DRAFT_955140 [Mycena crocata]